MCSEDSNNLFLRHQFQRLLSWGVTNEVLYTQEAVATSNSILVVVIGSKGRLRSQSLELSLASEIDNVLFVEPVLIGTEDRQETIVNERLSEIICGKRLSNSELGCAIAHKNARIKARHEFMTSDVLKWTLFVEDDADLGTELLSIIDEELRDSNIALPAIVDYCHETTQDSVLTPRTNKEERAFRAVRYLSPRTLCYAINREGLNKLHSIGDLPIDCVADWPVQIAHLSVFVPVATRVVEVEVPTSMGYRTQPKHWARVYFRQFLHLYEVSRLYQLSVRLLVRHLWMADLNRAARHWRSVGSARLTVLRANTVRHLTRLFSFQ